MPTTGHRSGDRTGIRCWSEALSRYSRSIDFLDDRQTCGLDLGNALLRDLRSSFAVGPLANDADGHRPIEYDN